MLKTPQGGMLQGPRRFGEKFVKKQFSKSACNFTIVCACFFTCFGTPNGSKIERNSTAHPTLIPEPLSEEKTADFFLNSTLLEQKNH